MSGTMFFAILANVYLARVVSMNQAAIGWGVFTVMQGIALAMELLK